MRVPFSLIIILLIVASAGCQTTTARDPGGVVEGTVSAADGVTIAYDVRGSGNTALVFVHGWCSNRTFWREQLDVLAKFLDGRKSSPRCLECFSEDIVQLPDEEEFECPDGNRYKRNGFGHASMRVEVELTLSREGPKAISRKAHR